MDDIREKLEKLERVDGFLAAGAFDTEGALIAQFSSVKQKRWKEICDITNEVFDKTQKLSDVIGIGKTHFVHMTLLEGNILVQGLDKHPNKSEIAIDRIVVFLNPKGNTALGKMSLHSLVKEITGDY